MFCMKCGKKIDDAQVFCPECLAVMEQFPVKPGTAIQLPARPVQPPVKKAASRKKEIPVEKRLQRCKRIIAALSAALVTAVLLLGIAVALLVQQARDEVPSETKGKNYSTIAPPDSTY